MLDLFIFAMSYSLSCLNKLKVLSGVDGTLIDMQVPLKCLHLCGCIWLPLSSVENQAANRPE